jgi:hypothetical protein
MKILSVQGLSLFLQITIIFGNKGHGSGHHQFTAGCTIKLDMSC